MDDYPQLKKRSRANVLNNYYNLMEAGMHKGTVRDNVWLLAYENNKLTDKLNCIKALNMDNNQLIPWLHLTQKELANYVLYVQQDMDSYTFNRMEYLSYKLECSIQQLCEVTVLNSFLMKVPVSSIDKKLNILYEYNVSNKDILKDVWVLRYSESHIRNRCELYKETGKLKIKTWAIRCPLRVISRAIQRNKVESSLMQNYGNINDYLQDKLKVNEEQLNLAIKKVPGVLRVNVAKLDRLIDILHQNGITSDEMLRYARIFFFNVETIQYRIEALKTNRLIPTVIVLIKDEQTFEQYIDTNVERRKFLEEYGSVKNYLINKLDVDEKLCDRVTAKYPSILRIKVKKLLELTDMLRHYDIAGEDIMSHPKIFHFNIETLRKRIELLKANGMPLRIPLIISNNVSRKVRSIEDIQII